MYVRQTETLGTVATGSQDPLCGQTSLDIAFFGPSLICACRNGVATYYRGIARALAQCGHVITFCEPDASGQQVHRDIDDPPWARTVVYPARDESGPLQALESARRADVIVKASAVGAHDALLEREVLALRRAGNVVIFWDIDAQATLERVTRDAHDAFHHLIPRYDLIFTRGGGQPVIDAYTALGARRCVPVYDALDPQAHHPVMPDPRFAGALGFLGDRLPECEARVRELFFEAARLLSHESFLLGGDGWDEYAGVLPNVRLPGRVRSRDQNAFYCSPRAVLDINCAGMTRTGCSPPARLFEAAGAGACLIVEAREGIEGFFEPGREILVARSGAEVAAHLSGLSGTAAAGLGHAARRRALAGHTYMHRARQIEAVLQGRDSKAVAA